MSRYLTAPKVSLLALIVLYCEGVVPHEGVVSVLAFIADHIVPLSPRSSEDIDDALNHNFWLNVSDFEEKFGQEASIKPGRSVYDLFLAKIWHLDSLNALHEFFESLPQLVAKTREAQLLDAEAGIIMPTPAVVLSRASPMGQFVRRCRIEFTRLQFNDTMKLWTAFLKYKQPSEASWRRRNPGAFALSFDANLKDLNLRKGDALFEVAYGSLMDEGESEQLAMSTEDVERLLEFQLYKVQRMGIRVPQAMKKRFREMIGPAVTVPSVSHFVKFFDAWRAGDYTASFDNLHRYFDYTMQSRDKTNYQYALLHMAILHADFGCFSEALATMNEAIATARENQDITCLNYSLSWLNHFNKAYPQEMKGGSYSKLLSSEKEALAFLKSKARENRLWDILSSTLLSEAKLMLSNGESMSRALEFVYQASHLNLTYNIRSNVGAQLLMQSSTYGRLGAGPVSNEYCEMILSCYNTVVPMEEILRSICRKAFSFARCGLFDKAFATLHDVDPAVHRTLKFHQYLLSYTGLLKLRRALKRMDLIAAEHLLKQLKAGAASDPEIRFQITISEIDYLVRISSFSDAFNLIEDVADGFKDASADIYQRIHILVTKANLFAKCGKPERGFSLAMRAASTAHRAKVLPSMWEAVATLSNILNHLSEFDAARQLLEAIIPQAIEGNDCTISGQLNTVLADAFMGLAGKGDGVQRSQCMTKAELYLTRAQDYFSTVEDVQGQCETIYKQAMIARTRGDQGLADNWASRYVATTKHYEQLVMEDQTPEATAAS
ncbi:putative anaphase-promoting complex subunit Apc5 [Eremomyces bilateralis CBS 781.70]|uniref:Anaphase-promoting complex subunit 5 n=1 Tax=Eremomyces bilateralis CBS 781.70 TaxID=1392243 RepID=A0A6G1FZH4_9PEZI|nr:putative anaphase-promoting complex subunit Apc5 [Eremomyces bilateralis CBS 781.70]KAF1811076.1 putative anaphase-promoting complex subunit Apc5 [Eremomyces bilateralis CBS 781.70]